MAATKQYELTDEHRAQLKPWADKWIKNTLNTTPMTDEDRRIMREAVKGMYKVAGKTPPPDERIIFVESPVQAAFLAGLGAWLWFCHKNPQKTKPVLDEHPINLDQNVVSDDDPDAVTLRERAANFMRHLRAIAPK